MITVYVDGLTEPVNPGGVGTIGFAVYRDGERLHREARVIGEGPTISNNRAEYEALNGALQWLLEHGLSAEEVEVHSDSRLLVNQMQGRWAVKGGLYMAAHERAKILASRFPRLSIRWVPREENEEADSLSREAYERYVGSRASRRMG